ncbi:MAG: hypothetical protein US52_C0050G0002 [candidate division WS6 bacterium GW2011_GWA2_37_6]|uniref:Uncharacterized protein n=1 Tax=candidate division WS6 bacterium GW2011_GWA2_37_6 TaxID=1619087 RepID=A0A0G0K228_9BACT|nr:MAG: hypothetical protein US52_C0050G0002 [candidate division WS6 bacterium GW2011_GWA2_37_6]
MEQEKLAVKIYKEVAQIGNRELALLTMLKLLKDEKDIEKVIEIYEQIINKEIIVVAVLSRSDLNSSEKERIENNVKKEVGDKKIIFDYSTNPDMGSLLTIKIEDKVLTLDIN